MKINSSEIIQIHYGSLIDNDKYMLIFEGNFYMLMNSDECPDDSIPLDDNGKYIEKFPRFSSNGNYTHVTEGNNFHHHSFDIRLSFITSICYTPQGALSGNPACGCQHSHIFQFDTFDESLVPLYYDVKFCKTKELKFYENLIVGLVSNQSLIDFSMYISEIQELNDRYIRNNHNGGVIGGKADHTHGHSEVNSSAGINVPTQNPYANLQSGNEIPSINHYHFYPGGSVTYEENNPPSCSIKFGVFGDKQMKKDEERSFLKQQIYFSDEYPPLGYYEIPNFDEGSYIKASSQTGECSTGSEEHTHDKTVLLAGSTETHFLMQNSQANGDYVNTRSQDILHTTHHRASETTTNSVNSLPSSFNVLLLTRKTEDIKYTIDEFENSFVAVEEILMILYITSGVVGSVILVICCFLVFTSTIFCCVYRNNRKSMKKFQELERFNVDVDILLEESKASQGNPKLKINSKLFEIKHEEVKLVSHIGVGGSGCQIYRAKWNNRDVAYKVFRTNLFTSTGDYQDFEKEINILSSISHPSVLQFYGAVIKPPRLGIVFEFCSYGTLRSYCEINSVVIDEKIRMTKQICSGMKYIHSRNIIHRDLKGDNVLITSSVDCKIIDFGLSKFLEENSKLTKRIGTSGILAPEMFSSSKYTNKVDVFSFGILLFEIMENNFNPYGNTPAVDAKVCNDPTFRPKFTKKDQLPKYIVQIIETSWSHNPKERMNFAEIMKVLDEHHRSQPQKVNRSLDKRSKIEKVQKQITYFKKKTKELNKKNVEIREKIKKIGK